MLRLLITLYIVVFGLYVWFSRQPDYFDGEMTPATIHFIADSTNGKSVPMAVFMVNKDEFRVNAQYIFRHLHEGQRVQVIYETAHPENGAVYRWWGYWFTWGECLGSIILLLGLFQLAVEVTKRPTPEALLEEQEMDRPQFKRKYKE